MSEIILVLVLAIGAQVALFAALWWMIKRAERPVPPEDAELLRRIVERNRSRHEVAP